MTKKLIIWDIDGTLLLTGGAGKVAFGIVFLEMYGIENAWQDIKPHGRTDVSLIKECYEMHFNKMPTDDEVQEITKRYIKVMPDALNNSANFRLMPHVVETLNKFSKMQGVTMGLATGNFKETAWDKLKTGKIEQYFTFGGYGCDGEDRLHLTEKALENGEKMIGGKADEVFLIGDTVNDVNCGIQIGATVVAVCTSNASQDELKAAGAHIVIKDLSDLPEI